MFQALSNPDHMLKWSLAWSPVYVRDRSTICLTEPTLLALQDRAGVTSPPPSLSRRHLCGAGGPSFGGPAEVHGGAGGSPLLLHRLQGPAQEPGPHRQLGGGGAALGRRPGEGHQQHQGPGPPAEDRAVSFLGSSWRLRVMVAVAVSAEPTQTIQKCVTE